MTQQKIIPCLWFDHQAKAAAEFYISLFKDSQIGTISHYGKEGFDIHGQPEGKVMTVEFELAGYKFVGLNGGPHFNFTPAISFFVTCESAAEVDTLWQKLSAGGSVLMELNKYDWSEKYGWLQDQYGLSWQIALGKLNDTGQKIVPFLMFVREQHGKAEEAMRFYTSVFKNSSLNGILRYGAGEMEPEGTVMHAQFALEGEQFMVMDSALEHLFTFNEAISFQVYGETQAEVDYYWEKLGAGGDPQAQQCGWLKDKYGVSWQVIPTAVVKMLNDPDHEKSERVMKAVLDMKKIDIKVSEQAYKGG